MKAEDIQAMGPDAVALLVNLMRASAAENGKIQLGLVDSLMRDLDAARAEISMIRANVTAVLAVPHTDYMVEAALWARRPYKLDSSQGHA
jgi:hypothetical protein